MNDAGELSVATIDAILAVNIEEEYHLLLKGKENSQSVTETGDSRIHASSENPFVEHTSSMIFSHAKALSVRAREAAEKERTTVTPKVDGAGEIAKFKTARDNFGPKSNIKLAAEVGSRTPGQVITSS